MEFWQSLQETFKCALNILTIVAGKKSALKINLETVWIIWSDNIRNDKSSLIKCKQNLTLFWGLIKFTHLKVALFNWQLVRSLSNEAKELKSMESTHGPKLYRQLPLKFQAEIRWKISYLYFSCGGHKGEKEARNFFLKTWTIWQK